MKHKKTKRINKNLLPFPVIKAATEGDVEAIQIVLRHYEGYIIKLSTRKGYNAFGEEEYYVDETLKRRLETKLIEKTLTFCPIPYKKGRRR